MQSPKGKLSSQDWGKWRKNLVKFTSPLLVLFFGALAQGVPLEQAVSILLVAVYQALADLFSKLSSGE